MACGYYIIESLSGNYFTAFLGATAGTAGNVPTHFIASDSVLTDFKCVVIHPQCYVICFDGWFGKKKSGWNVKKKRKKFRFEQFSAPSGTHQPDRNSNLPPTSLIRLAQRIRRGYHLPKIQKKAERINLDIPWITKNTKLWTKCIDSKNLSSKMIDQIKSFFTKFSIFWREWNSTFYESLNLFLKKNKKNG